MVRGRVIRNQQGQSIVEYILLLSAVVSFYWIVSQGLARLSITQRFIKPLKTDFAKAYQYGDTKTIGPTDPEGVYENHAQAREPENGNFRIFISPRKP